MNEIDVAIIRELPSQDLCRDGLFELRANEVEDLAAFLRQHRLRQELPEDQRRHTDSAPVLAYDCAEFDAYVIRIPSNTFISKF